MQFVNYRHRQRRTPADTNGRRVPGQERRKPGSTHRYLASDKEAAGSNPATPTGKRQVTGHQVACRSHYAFPGVRFWEPVGSEHR